MEEAREKLLERLRGCLPSTEPTWADTHYLNQGGGEDSGDFSYDRSDESFSSSEDMSVSEDSDLPVLDEVVLCYVLDSKQAVIPLTPLAQYKEESAAPLIKFLYRDPIEPDHETPIRLFVDASSHLDFAAKRALVMEFCAVAPEESDCDCGVKYDPSQEKFQAAFFDGSCKGSRLCQDCFFDGSCNGTRLCQDCQGWGQKSKWLEAYSDMGDYLI